VSSNPKFTVSSSSTNVDNLPATITVTYTPTGVTSVDDEATITVTYNDGADTSTATIDFTGSAVLECDIAAPTALAASNVGKTQFTANWSEVTGASGYQLFVYTKEEGGTTTEVEGFDGVVRDGTTNKMDFGASTISTGWTLNLTPAASRHIYFTDTNYGTSSPSICFSTTGDYVETKTYDAPITAFSFWAKQQSGTTSSTLIEGFNGTSWATIETLSNGNVISTGSGETHTVDLTSFSDIVKIRMTFTKVAGNLAIDDVSITYGGVTRTPVAGYNPKTISGGSTISQSVTGLQEGTTYYYVVKAVGSGACAGELSAASNEVSATTSTATSVTNTSMVARLIYSQGNQVVLSAAAGEVVTVYNTVGQLLARHIATNGENRITLNYSGVVLVKAGNDVAKIVVR
jgi:hypothetical protein